MKQLKIIFLTALILLACSMDEGDSKINPVEPKKSNWIVELSSGNPVDSESKLFVPYGFNSVHVWLDEA